MKIEYKGFELTAKRDLISGHPATFGTAIRKSDNLDLVGEVEGDFSIQDMMEELKAYVDDYIKNPESF